MDHFSLQATDYKREAAFYAALRAQGLPADSTRLVDIRVRYPSGERGIHALDDVRVDDVPEPTILNPRDAIIKVTSTAICGSDLHLYDGYLNPMMKKGDAAKVPRGLVKEGRRFDLLLAAGKEGRHALEELAARGIRVNCVCPGAIVPKGSARRKKRWPRAM